MLGGEVEGGVGVALGVGVEGGEPQIEDQPAGALEAPLRSALARSGAYWRKRSAPNIS